MFPILTPCVVLMKSSMPFLISSSMQVGRRVYGVQKRFEYGMLGGLRDVCCISLLEWKMLRL